MLSVLKPIAGRMPLYVRLMYMILADPSVRKRHKALLSAGLLYAVSPVDLVPGVIPVVGQVDDIMVALSTLLRVLKRLPSDRRTELLSSAGLRLETLESDLEAARSMALFLATRPIAYARDAARWTGKAAGNLLRGLGKLGRLRNK
ncbi:MAG: YkvA family protein [Bacillota bacterium]